MSSVTDFTWLTTTRSCETMQACEAYPAQTTTDTEALFDFRDLLSKLLLILSSHKSLNKRCQKNDMLTQDNVLIFFTPGYIIFSFVFHINIIEKKKTGHYSNQVFEKIL